MNDSADRFIQGMVQGPLQLSSHARDEAERMARELLNLHRGGGGVLSWGLCDSCCLELSFIIQAGLSAIEQNRVRVRGL